MLLRSKTLVLLICLFLVAFKATAGCIFIQSAIERAELAGSCSHASISEQAQSVPGSADDKEQVHTMYLMSHVTANISNVEIVIFVPQISTHKFALTNESLFTQNFPDSAFKPPRRIA